MESGTPNFFIYTSDKEFTVSIVQLYTNPCGKFLGLIKEFEYLFDVTLGKWDNCIQTV